MSITRPIAGRITQPIPRALNAPGVGGGGSFDPASLFSSGEKGFAFDFSTTAGLFQDAARTTPTTTSGQPVGGVTDLSPNAAHASWSGAGARPTWDGSGAVFDGSSTNLATSSITWGTDAVTIVIGMTKSSDATQAIVIEIGGGGASANQFSLFAPNANATANYAMRSRGSAFADALASSVAAPNTSVISGLGRISTDVCRIYRNGVLAQSVSTDQGTGSAYAAGPVNLGHRNAFGARSAYLNGKIIRVLCINRLLTDQEREQSEAWAGDPFS